MMGLHSPCPALLDLACELRTETMPPVPNRFIAHIDTAFMQKVFYISQWEWEPHIQHNCKLDNLRAGFEIAERYWFVHSWVANVQHAVGQGGLFWQCLRDSFRQYDSYDESIADYGSFLQQNKRYKLMLQAATLREQVEALGKSGYATDPEYADKVMAIAKSKRLEALWCSTPKSHFQKATQTIPASPKASVVAGGLYAAQMTFSGSYSTTAHQSGGIRATTENGGVLRSDGVTRLSSVASRTNAQQLCRAWYWNCYCLQYISNIFLIGDIECLIADVGVAQQVNALAGTT